MKEILNDLPLSSLPVLENYLKGLLKEVHAKVAEAHMHEVQKRQNQSRFERWARLAYHFGRKFQDDDEAVSHMMATGSFEIEQTARLYLKRARKKLAIAARQRRNLKIASLIDKGYTNADIARTVGISPSLAAKTAAKAKGIKI